LGRRNVHHFCITTTSQIIGAAVAAPAAPLSTPLRLSVTLVVSLVENYNILMSSLWSTYERTRLRTRPFRTVKSPPEYSVPSPSWNVPHHWPPLAHERDANFKCKWHTLYASRGQQYITTQKCRTGGHFPAATSMLRLIPLIRFIVEDTFMM